MSSSLRALLPIALLALPALVFVLWPLRRLGERARAAAPDDRRLELGEERGTVLRALRELDFDHEAGHIADDDYRALRDRYEGRAAGVLAALDALGPAPPAPAPAAPAPRGWTRSPFALATGGAVLVAFGVVLGVSAGRYTERDQMVTPPGARLPVPAAATPGATSGERAPLPAGTLAGMLEAARQALGDGQYAQAIAAYQAVLKREPRNVDALTHLALIVALGGHKDEALRTLDRALAIDAGYAPAHLYRGQVLFDKQDYAGAVAAWERFVALAPPGTDRDRVRGMIEDARARQAKG
jgi:tetratricopeptide (TPR) repeat protein